MGNNEKITVLVTFYNQEKYVDDALESVFMQETSFPIQVIVGDDGSSDGTIDKVYEWQAKYPGKIRVVIQEREDSQKYVRGVRASRNRLSILKLVDTPYFIFLDGDDYFTDKTKLQKQYDLLNDSKNSDCVACAHNIRMYNEATPDKETYIPGKKFKEGKYSLEKYWDTAYFHTDTILFRSEHIKDLKLNIVEDSFNDNLITYSFMQFGKILFIRDCMADYRQNEQGIWAGEKVYVSLIREFLAYDLECQINPSMKRICTRRHCYNFKVFLDDHDVFDNVSEEYLAIAKKYNCETARRALEDKHLFSSDWGKDNKAIQQIIFQRRMQNIHTLPFRAVRKIWRMVCG